MGVLHAALSWHRSPRDGSFVVWTRQGVAHFGWKIVLLQIVLLSRPLLGSLIGSTQQERHEVIRINIGVLTCAQSSSCPQRLWCAL